MSFTGTVNLQSIHTDNIELLENKVVSIKDSYITDLGTGNKGLLYYDASGNEYKLFKLTSNTTSGFLKINKDENGVETSVSFIQMNPFTSTESGFIYWDQDEYKII